MIRQHLIACSALVGLVLLCSCSSSETEPEPDPPRPQASPAVVADTLDALLAHRAELDKTVFASEVDAQRHEQTIVQLWDRLLAGDRWQTLIDLHFDEFVIGDAVAVENQDWGLSGIRAWRLDGNPTTLAHQHYRKMAESLRDAGWLIDQTEWHHASFTPAADGEPAQSLVSFEIDAKNERQTRRAIVRGRLQITWSGKSDLLGAPLIARVRATDVQVITQTGPPMFKSVMVIDPKKVPPKRYPRVNPLMLYDLDGDGLSEIILGGCNLLYRNLGEKGFVQEDFLKHGFKQMAEPGIIADFTGDGRPDFVGLSLDELRLRIFETDADGKFTRPSRICFEPAMKSPYALTAGDIDGDGDLDLFVGQWKAPYDQGSMPTPFWDANDGHPDYLLRNDGEGNFTDVTAAAGLEPKRNRRSYSASLVDLDDDVDLDLLVVSDFSGLDLYRNDGGGNFTDVTNQWVDERHAFGMSHTLDDFDGDGRLDFYMIGMSSTTARRLEQLGLNREGFEGHQKNRMAMAYGNRMYLSRDGRYRQPSFQDQVARSGWSWGCTSADFDNDGDRDVYVANGHLSGRSTQDYCTRFWCHDVYEGSSQPNSVLDEYVKKELGRQLGSQLSWNGYEHNVLFANAAGRGFHNLGYLCGAAFEFDSRAVVSDDLDGDGRMDLLVVQFVTAEFQQRLHVLKNQSEGTNHWVGVRLRGDSNVSPIGATVTATAGKRKWVSRIVTGDSFTAQHANTVHFGLGEVSRLERLEVRWPDGQTSRVEDPKLGTYHVMTRPES